MATAGLDPWTSLAAIDEGQLRQLVGVGRHLIRANAGAGASFDRDVGLGPARLFVYGRAGRPCRRGVATIRSARLGAQARTVFWCPSCQRRNGTPSA